jgi:ankyrin repeat protein
MPAYLDDYDYVLEILKSGSEDQLKELELLIDGFPCGIDIYGRQWIITAIENGSLASVAWMLSRGIDLTIPNEKNYSIIHEILDHSVINRYELLNLMLKHGAPINDQASNDWTPAHWAAVNEDIDALELLVRYGADLTIRTRIDNYATPLEEARTLRKARAVQFLENL